MICSCHCNEGWREVPGLSTCLVPNDQPLSAAILALLVEVPNLGSELHRSNIFITFALLHCALWRHLTFFRVTAPSWVESIGHRWIPLTGASDAELWRFLWPAPQQTVKTNNGDADYLRRHRAHHDVTAMLFMKLKLIALACINSLSFNGANSNRCIMPYDLPISANYAESKLRYKFHMFLLCCMYHIGSNRDIPKVDLIAI